MNPNRFFMSSPSINPVLMRGGYIPIRSPGLLRQLTTGIRSFNWNKLLTGANKTLNVMNQTIPLFKQAKPMIGNFKSMLNLAKAFKNESTPRNIYSKNMHSMDKPVIKEKNEHGHISDNYPAFFV